MMSDQNSDLCEAEINRKIRKVEDRMRQRQQDHRSDQAYLSRLRGDLRVATLRNRIGGRVQLCQGFSPRSEFARFNGQVFVLKAISKRRATLQTLDGETVECLPENVIPA